MVSMHHDVLFAMAAHHDFKIYQVNIKGAYINSEFKEGEVIYMCLPPGIHLTDSKALVLQLLKPIYISKT